MFTEDTQEATDERLGRAFTGDFNGNEKMILRKVKGKENKRSRGASERHR